MYLIGYYEESIFAPYIREWAAEFPQFSIKYLREYTALGTAGGLYHFRDAIMKGNPKRLFVLNADVCCSFPLKEMLDVFEEKEAEAVLLGTRVSEDAARNFGCESNLHLAILHCTKVWNLLCRAKTKPTQLLCHEKQHDRVYRSQKTNIT